MNNDMGATNREVYQSKGTVESYRQEERLQPAEQNILELLKEKLFFMKMLDIGVGAGRTTVHFAPLVKEYLGIDFSPNMIKACQERFAGLSFQTLDARSMEAFKDGAFDFILFSYNGIDYINHEDRAKALKEIKRVGKPGGFFCFSTHHLGYIKNFRQVSLNRNIIHSWHRLTQVNDVIRSQMPFAVIRDGGEDFKVQTYYIMPSLQLTALHQMGFSDIRIFLGTTGKEVTGLSGVDLYTQERWLYYLCRI